MARAATATEMVMFIEKIAPLAQKAYKELGKVKPSVCIGMACIESGYGLSQIMSRHHAYMGHKVGTGKTATKYWRGDFFRANTTEEYTIGVHTAIKSDFRAYPTDEMCIFNFYELLNTSLYSKVKASGTYKTQMAQIKSVGYMTSSTEVNSVIKVIETHNLTKYDFDGTPNYKPITPELIGSVIAGNYGNGKAREAALIEEGYNYSEVRKKINDLDKIAKEILPTIKSKAGEYWECVIKLLNL